MIFTHGMALSPETSGPIRRSGVCFDGISPKFSIEQHEIMNVPLQTINEPLISNCSVSKNHQSLQIVKTSTCGKERKLPTPLHWHPQAIGCDCMPSTTPHVGSTRSLSVQDAAWPPPMSDANMFSLASSTTSYASIRNTRPSYPTG